MWFEVKDVNGIKHLLNSDAILDVEYHEDSNLTEIIFTRAAYPGLYVRNNLTSTVKRCLSSSDKVHNIGE